MFDSIRASLIPSERRAGFVRAVLSTTNYKWSVSDSDFEVVYGLSKLVHLIPDKLVTTFAVLADCVPAPCDDDGFFVDVLLSLLLPYEALALRRPPELGDHVGLAGVRTFSFNDSRRQDEDARVGNVSRDLASTVTWLYSRLLTVRYFARENKGRQLSVAVAEALSVAETVRELCLVYLNLVHPLIGVERVSEAALQRRAREVAYLLTETRFFLRHDYAIRLERF